MQRLKIIGHLGFGSLVLALLFPVVVQAAFPPELGPLNNTEQWGLLMLSARATHYGPYYQAGMLTASGEPYAPDGDGCAVGPTLLKRLRSEYAEASGTFTILPTWAGKPQEWGWTLRLTDTEGHSVTCRVNDSGLDGLEIDLPDGAWERAWGDKGQGVKITKVEILH